MFVSNNLYSVQEDMNLEIQELRNEFHALKANFNELKVLTQSGKYTCKQILHSWVFLSLKGKILAHGLVFC